MAPQAPPRRRPLRDSNQRGEARYRNEHVHLHYRFPLQCL
jgi:hypothetical protein